MVETTRHDVKLAGCTPEPLMAYLKALGTLRLVSEQKDAEARGWWKNDVFWLRCSLDRDALVKFFLEEYKPTPIVAPWNGGAGFYLKWDEKNKTFKRREANDAVSQIESSTTPRLQPYRDQLLAIKRALQEYAKPTEPAALIKEVRNRARDEGRSKRKTDQEVKQLLDSQMFFSVGGTTYAIKKVDKDVFLSDVRSSFLDDIAVQWLDAAFVIRTGLEKNRSEAPLLGSGGNIGNSDFSARFMQILVSCLPMNDDEHQSNDSEKLLRGALFGHLVIGLSPLAVDQFDPGRAGGANMYQGLEAGSSLNPWDYILMLEGAIILQSASSKRLGSNLSGSAFPFTVESTPSGFDSSGTDKTRGEQWLPLWNRACKAIEIAAVLAEGRSELGRRNARNGVEFARAAASLGVDRGIKQFVRIQYQPRLGDNYLANTLGRFDVAERESVDLLRQIDPWLDDFRWKCAQGSEKEKAPARILATLNRIDSAIFEFCKYGSAGLFQDIVISLGRAERELALTQGKFKKKSVTPIPPLSSDWVAAADDGSKEFAIARALAPIHDPERKVGPLRANLEPVDWQAHCRKWAEKDRSVVWNAADSATNLAAALQRRLMDAARRGCQRLPLAYSAAVPLDIVAAFIANELDDERIEELIWGLMLISDHGHANRDRGEAHDAATPRAYALLKLLFLPRPLVIERAADGTSVARMQRNNESGGFVIRPEASIPQLLRAGRLGEACGIAMRRLRASGLDPMPRPIRGRRVRDDDWQELNRIGGSGIDPRRLAAALLIPIGDNAVGRLVRFVISGDDTVNDLAEAASGASF